MIVFLLTQSVGQAWGESNRHVDRESQLIRYYDLLDSLKNDPTTDYISSLTSFLEKNPNIDRAYQSIFEISVANGELTKAKSYFESAGESNNYGYSEWMMSRIYAIEGRLNFALSMLWIAIKKNPDNFEILEDLVELVYLTDRPEVELHTKLHSLREKQQLVVSALLEIRNQNYTAALTLFERLPEEYHEDLAIVSMTGYCLFKIKAFQKAKALFNRGLKLAEASHDRYNQAIFLMRNGMIAVSKKNFEEARSNYEQANKIAMEIRSLGLLSKLNGNLGSLHFSEAEFEKALKAYQLSYRNATLIGSFNEAAAWCFGKALALRSLKRYDEAVLSLEKSRSYSMKTKNNILLTQVYLEKGNLFSSLSLNNLAIREYERAYALAQRDSSLNENLRAFGGIAAVLITEGKYHKARNILTELLKLDRSRARSIDKAYWKFKFAESYMLEGRLTESKIAFWDAYDFILKLKKSDYARYVMASALLNIAEIEVTTGSLAEGERIYGDSLLNNVALNRSDLKLGLDIGLGTLYLKKGLIEQAVNHFTSADQIFEKRRKELKVEQFRIGYAGRETKVIESMIQALLSVYVSNRNPSDLTELLSYCERNSARTIIEKKLNKTNDYNDADLRDDHANYREAVKRLKILQRRIRENPVLAERNKDIYETLKYNLLSQRLTILNAVPDHKETQQVTLKKIQEVAANSGMTMLVYHISSQGSFVLSAGDSSLDLVELSAKPSLISSLIDSLLSPFHFYGGNRKQRATFSAGIANQLYRLIFEPIEKQLEPRNKLLIVPDPILAGLPFELLLAEKPGLRIYRHDDPPNYMADLLLYRYSFSYSPALSLAIGRESRRKENPNILVMANPFGPPIGQTKTEDYHGNRPTWDSRKLWYSDFEADMIKTIHPNTTVLKRNDASKKKLKQVANDYDLLHFATHAFVDSSFDAFSGLVLSMSSDSIDDGLLMGYEISDLDLESDLVTLSACQTGQGQVVAGEGVMGLPRLFLGAGANSVLMTLWQVDDRFASELMPKFYEYLLRKKMTKVEALAQAKRDLLEQYAGNGSEYRHPFYWAAFTLYGNPGSVTEPQEKLAYFILIIPLGLLILFGARYFFQIRQRQELGLNRDLKTNL